MNVGPTPPPVDLNLIEQTRRQINKLVEEIAQLSEQDLPPNEYYREFLQRVLTALAAPAGAVWTRTQQGNLQVQYHQNLKQVGLDKSDTDRQMHDELLRQTAQNGRAVMVPPRSGTATAGPDGKPAPGNPTDYMILMAPMLVDKQVAGLVEVWQDADRNPEAQRGFLNFLTRMAELASSYTRNHQLRHITGQQQLWTQLENFARQIHNSLNPTEVAYVVANEGRRLIDCDRVSVAQRTGRKAHIEAISGADIVEKRSNLVRLMATLAEKVLNWGEKLTYRGIKDDTLPPDVLDALDAYLAESNSKLLVVLPLKDDREENSKRPPRSAVLMECFDPSATPDQLIARMDVIGKHATSALYNAAEHKRIPMRFVWMPLARLQEGLGGKAKAITWSVIAALIALTLVLIFVPYPLKMDANGQMLPRDRRWIYSPRELGQIMDIRVQPGAEVNQGDQLVLMRDLELMRKLADLQGQISGLNKEVDALNIENRSATKQADRDKLSAEIISKEAVRDRKQQEFDALVTAMNADRQNLGYFWLTAPIAGTVLNSDFKETLTNRVVKPNEPILRIGQKGDKPAAWEIELKIPQKHIGQVLQAYEFLKKQDPDRADELDVDILVLSDPTRTFRGKLSRKDIGGEAIPNRDNNNESDPVVLAFVRIDGDDIPKDMQLPHDMLVTGTEIHAKIRCGNHAMGYSLFYGVWEFLYEKVVFFF